MLGFGLDYCGEASVIANQCPYKGGNAVYRARALLSLIGSNYIYDDFSVCATEGIYRSQKPEKKNDAQIHLIPNPASDWVDVVLTGNEKGICRLNVYNEVNQLTGEYEFNCTNKSYRLATSKWQPGIYSVRIIIANENSITAKLVIIR